MTKAIDRLTVRRRAYVENRAKGLNKKDSAREAGLSSSTSAERDPDVQAAYRDLVRQVIPEQKIVNLIKGGLEATTPVFTQDGRKRKDRPDWKTRLPYIKMAREDAGYVEAKGDSNQTLIAVTVQHIGQDGPKAQPIIEVTTQAE